jgi:hypothetical protein
MGSSSNHNIFVFISWQRSYTRNSLSKLQSNFRDAPSSWAKIKEKLLREVLHVSLPKETIRPQNPRQNRNGVQMITEETERLSKLSAEATEVENLIKTPERSSARLSAKRNNQAQNPRPNRKGVQMMSKLSAEATSRKPHQ